MAENASLPAPPVFKGENYNFWSIKIKAFFMAYDLWETVEKGYEPSLQDNPTIAEMKKQKEDSTKNFKAPSFLHLAVDDSYFQELWGNNSKISLGCSSLGVSRFRKDQMTVDKVLVIIPNKFESRIVAIEESKDLSKLSINELSGSLQAQEQRFNLQFGQYAEGAFQARNNFKYSSSKGSKFQLRNYPPCGICKKTSHEEKDYWHEGKPQCFKCKRFGHVQKACRSKEDHTSNVAQEKKKKNLCSEE
ncbi:hypothetical protein GH714_003095 [Hevea brasiliensis]|uniref:CCHC-type domain-containing protein n=1 Tax=Hevea brasiliensis TaxID=3981 RepID=A0A6A6LYH2_HEVBR|nr:hypothetical protein GH714_003095 [Hevea brasiliensis]